MPSGRPLFDAGMRRDLALLRFVRPLAIFLLLYLASSGALYFGIPRLMAWHVANCVPRSSEICSATSIFLSRWWLAELPVLVLVTLLVNRAAARWRADSIHANRTRSAGRDA